MGLAKPSSPVAVSPTPASAPVPRILIADDCPGTREVVAQMFGAEFETVLLDNGISAWERLQSDALVVALITDLDMPGLDGYQLITQVRASSDARVRNLPVIAITGAADNETRRRVFVSGATGLITKPIDRNQLLDLARVYVRQVRVEPVADAAPAPVARDVSEVERVDTHTQTDPVRSESIEFDPTSPAPVETAKDAIPGPMPTSVAPPPGSDPIEDLSVSELEQLIQKEVPPRAARTPPAPVQEAIPAELISIDAALQAIADGRGMLLIPYLSQLEQRIQPLLDCYRKHRG